jgi:KaiC/GvpD/RAD55 family RecA-like ATPase
MNLEDRTQTGIKGLDENLEGGFPRGSMVMIAGNPGTGKTMFCGEFLHHGAAECTENGLYVSFSEGRETFLGNMRKFGRDFEEMEEQGRFEIMDVLTSREPGIDAIIEMITSRIDENQTQRLVIDSFTAMANAFPTPIDERVVLHLLSKIVRMTGCTTLLVTEVPTGRDTIGTGIEEFIVDGAIILRRRLLDGCVLRELEISKMRGTLIREHRQIFSLHGGFTVFNPFREEPTGEPRPFRKTPNKPDCFSTGSPELDQLLGGYGRGDTVLLELGAHVPLSAPAHMFGPLCANFLAHEMGVLLIPPCGQNVGRVLGRMKGYGVDEERLDGLMRIAEIRNEAAGGSSVFRLDPDDIRVSHQIWNEEKRKLMGATGKQVLKLVNIDSVGIHWPLEQARRAMETESKLTKDEGGLLALLSTSGDEGLGRDASNMASIHLRLINAQGAMLLQGVRPRTPLFVLEATGAEGYPRIRLTPMN